MNKHTGYWITAQTKDGKWLFFSGKSRKMQSMSKNAEVFSPEVKHLALSKMENSIAKRWKMLQNWMLTPAIGDWR